MKLDDRTERVVEMYSKYPFPSGTNHGNYFEQIVLPVVRELQQHYPIHRLLDAGCGTGNVAADIATFLPEVEITAIDLTDESLNQARQWIADRGLRNITFRKSNLMEFDPELGQFDFVYSQGVIHHLSTPVLGMKHLNRYLKADHHAFVWLYSLLGRRDILDMREALKVLGADKLTWDEKINLAKEVRPLFYSGRRTILRKVIKLLDYVDKYGFNGLGDYLKEYFKRSSHEDYDNIILADQILHPQDKFYRFSEAIQMFTESGFDFLRVLQGLSNSFEESFGAQNISTNGTPLSRVDRYTLIELHEKPVGGGYLIKKVKDVPRD
jgi:SAM-dependent methyltransferase